MLHAQTSSALAALTLATLVFARWPLIVAASLLGRYVVLKPVLGATATSGKTLPLTT